MSIGTGIAFLALSIAIICCCFCPYPVLAVPVALFGYAAIVDLGQK